MASLPATTASGEQPSTSTAVPAETTATSVEQPALYYINGGNISSFMGEQLIVEPQLPIPANILSILQSEKQARGIYVSQAESQMLDLLANKKVKRENIAKFYRIIAEHKLRIDALDSYLTKHNSLESTKNQWETVQIKRKRNQSTSSMYTTTTTANRFTPLATTSAAVNSQPITSTPSAANDPQAMDTTSGEFVNPAQTAPTPRSNKTTPIFLRDPNKARDLTKHLATSHPDVHYTIKNTSGTVAFIPETPDDHRKIRKILADSTVEFLTTLLPEEKHMFVTLKDLPMYVTEAEVTATLTELGYPVERVGQLRSNRSQPPQLLPHFRVALRKEGNSKNIFKETKMFNAIIRVEPYRPPARPLQCTNCQQFTHNAAGCRLTPVCSYCGEPGHKRQDCKLPGLQGSKPTCFNCGGDHSCRYAKCPVWQEARVEMHLNKHGQRTRFDAAPKGGNPLGLPKEAFKGTRYPGLPPVQRVQHTNYAAALTDSMQQVATTTNSPPIQVQLPISKVATVQRTAPLPMPPRNPRGPTVNTSTVNRTQGGPSVVNTRLPLLLPSQQPAQKRLLTPPLTSQVPRSGSLVPDTQFLSLMEKIPLHLQADFAAILAEALAQRPSTIAPQTILVHTVFVFMGQHGEQA